MLRVTSVKTWLQLYAYPLTLQLGKGLKCNTKDLRQILIFFKVMLKVKECGEFIFHIPKGFQNEVSQLEMCEHGTGLAL